MKMLSPFTNFTNDWWPRRSLASAFDLDFDDFAETFLRPLQARGGFQPTCDVKETKDNFLVCFDMPGVDKDDIRVEVEGNRLTVSGERSGEEKNEDESTLRHERYYGRFERSFVLPTAINADKIEARYEDGVLNVTLPKSEIAKGRQIHVQGSSAGNYISGKDAGKQKDVNGKSASKDVRIT